MVLVGEHEEPPSRVGAQGLEPVVHGEVLILHFVQHHRQHHDILNRRILQQIDLQQPHRASAIGTLDPYKAR